MIKHGCYLAALVAVTMGILCSGCGEPAGLGPRLDESAVRDAMAEIDAVCSNARGVTHQGSAAVYKQMRSAVGEGNDGELLLHLYQVYTARSGTWRAIAYDEINPFDVARVVLAERLAAIRHPDSPALLVDLLTDVQVDLQGETLNALSKAIMSLGRPCLSKLRAVPITHPRRKAADSLIDEIEGA
ncbi:MAG: hypothetical protein ACYS8X_02645 [Planctomycetota bacterium]|jgi:hypothetical protein